MLEFGRFSKLTVYRNSPQLAKVVLFVSGDGSWNQGVIDMTGSLTGHNALVVGIDITHDLKEIGKTAEKGTYANADFENLSKYIQNKSSKAPSPTPQTTRCSFCINQIIRRTPLISARPYKK